MADLGQATLELKTDNSDFDKGLDDAQSNISKFGTKATTSRTMTGV